MLGARARFEIRPVFRPSGHQQKTLMFKIAPGDFVSHYSEPPALHPFGVALRAFKFVPDEFVGQPALRFSN